MRLQVICGNMLPSRPIFGIRLRIAVDAELVKKGGIALIARLQMLK